MKKFARQISAFCILANGAGFIWITYWLDKRSGFSADSGYIKTTFELAKRSVPGGDYNNQLQSPKTKSLSYGVNGGYQ